MLIRKSRVWWTPQHQVWMALCGGLRPKRSRQHKYISGHLRAHESQFSPNIPEIPSQEQTVPPHSRRGTANPHFLASDIEIPIAPSTKSKTLHGEQRIVFEKTANMVRYHTWFVNPFLKPGENDSHLEGSWVKASTKLGWEDVQMGRAAISFVCLLIYKERRVGDWSKLIDMCGRNRGSQVPGHT